MEKAFIRQCDIVHENVRLITMIHDEMVRKGDIVAANIKAIQEGRFYDFKHF